MLNIEVRLAPAQSGSFHLTVFNAWAGTARGEAHRVEALKLNVEPETATM
jgi:hypothetical protein